MNGDDQGVIGSEDSSPEHERHNAPTTLKDETKCKDQGDVVPDQGQNIPPKKSGEETKCKDQGDVVPNQEQNIPAKTPKEETKCKDQGDVVPNQEQNIPAKTHEEETKFKDQGDVVPDQKQNIPAKTPEEEKTYFNVTVLDEENAREILKLCKRKKTYRLSSDQIGSFSKQNRLLFVQPDANSEDRKYPDTRNSKQRKSLKPSKVQFYVPIETATTKDFSNAIKDLVQDISIKHILCSGIGDLIENSPLVVVCPISSRLEPDIDSSIDGIKWNKTFVVLLLHSCLESSLPRLPTASKIGHNEKYKNIVFIDIAYTIDEKLYLCEMNEIAKAQLTSFLHHLFNK